jgi:hypothetical protein
LAAATLDANPCTAPRRYPIGLAGSFKKGGEFSSYLSRRAGFSQELYPALSF